MTKYNKKMFVRDKFDNYITDEWDIVASSSSFKEEFKNDESEKEVILSYANALNCITQSLLQQNHSPILVMTIRTNSLTIPFIFLARHTVELTLKYICKLLNITFPPKHKLMNLWKKIVERFNTFESTKRDELVDVTSFIEALEELDCDGSHSRYSKDKNGNLYNNNPKFINVKNINNFIQKLFVKFINLNIIIKK